MSYLRTMETLSCLSREYIAICMARISRNTVILNYPRHRYIIRYTPLEWNNNFVQRDHRINATQRHSRVFLKFNWTRHCTLAQLAVFNPRIRSSVSRLPNGFRHTKAIANRFVSAATDNNIAGINFLIFSQKRERERVAKTARRGMTLCDAAVLLCRRRGLR